MPSLPAAILTATLVGMLYTLVPVGRWRQHGKWVATGLVALFALARVYLGTPRSSTPADDPRRPATGNRDQPGRYAGRAAVAWGTT